jgi:hypothetical protein
MYQTVDIGDALMKEIFALVLGLILFISGYLTTKKREKRMRSGSTATGTIHEVVQKEEDPEDQLYYPVIRFVTADEEWIVKRYQTLLTAHANDILFDDSVTARYSIHKFKTNNYPILYAFFILLILIF